MENTPVNVISIDAMMQSKVIIYFKVIPGFNMFQSLQKIPRFWECECFRLYSWKMFALT